MGKPLHKAYSQHPFKSAVILRDVAEITDVQTEIKYNEQALKWYQIVNFKLKFTLKKIILNFSKCKILGKINTDLYGNDIKM